MINDSILKNTTLVSPILASSTLRPQGGGKSRKLMAGVILTSLVDAFSILVIYLLMNFSTTGEILYLEKDMQLPMAIKAQDLQPTTVVKLSKDQIFVGDEPVEATALVSALIDKRKELVAEQTDSTTQEISLTIQADKSVIYKKLSQIVQAGAHAGFEEIKFAVLFK